MYFFYIKQLVCFFFLYQSTLATIINNPTELVKSKRIELYRKFISQGDLSDSYIEESIATEEKEINSSNIKVDADCNHIINSFNKHSVIPLRNANASNNKILILGCGNREGDKKHAHKCCDTVDHDLAVNPSIIIDIEENPNGLRYFEENKYDIVIFEKFPSGVYSELLFEQLGRILTPDGTLAINFELFSKFIYLIENHPNRKP